MRGLSEKKTLSVLFLIFFLNLNPVSASFISITTDIGDVSIDGGNGQSLFLMKNQGDEAAFEVDMSLILPKGFSGKEAYIGVLEPNGRSETFLNITLTGDALPGVYPAVVIVNYRDANSYPFSAVTPFNIINRERTTSKVFGIFRELMLEGNEEETFTLSIKNPEDEPRTLDVRLYLPKELSSREREKTVSISPLGEAKIDFSVSSFSALPGSTYAVLASITYETEGREYTSFARGILKIEKENKLVSNQVLLAVLIILIALFLFYQIRGRK